MLKKLLTVVLPLILPFLVYWVYLLLAQRKARLQAEGRLPGWQDAPWPWIIVSGVVLMAAALGYVRVTTGVERTEPLLPPAGSSATVDPSPGAD